MDIADKEGTWFSVFGQGEIVGIPVPILLFALLAAVLGIGLAKTPFGRKVYAVGATEPRPPSRAFPGPGLSLPATWSRPSAWPLPG